MSLFYIEKPVARQYLLIKPALAMLLLLFPLSIQANDKSLLTNADAPPLGIGIALDSEGKPIPIPATRSALEYHAPPIHKPKQAKRKKIQHPKKKNTKTLSRKQQLASRVDVANDPSCRWLDSRMDKLEKSLSYTGNQASYAFHRNELKIRHKEWLCMKCGAEGPNQREYDTCQYRR
ncbi:hypothetical protein Sps_00182 [Shewanella psychrophila]|uniref:Uncharacterized protein n=1 Tax=Shewanella psychrophila TaxID=225848 RepID=A0A1S6HIQ8_9GAMM|nr:hypothetical protein [Shewanella psychrophila]AQS35402.1 hypothetical protein Sps_00182 [Shewanella psychrophila]